MTRQELARIGLRAACEARRKAGVSMNSPVCVYDIAEQLGAKVWFVGGASFAGMYARGYQKVFVPAERPAGRRAFTCAHELAHWWFKHGTRVEELDFDRSDNEVPEENIANQFAAYFLMPRQAVVEAFQQRALLPGEGAPLDIYRIACQLGVGYETLIKHMRWSLGVLGHARMKDLLAVPPKEIRRAVLGRAAGGYMVLADKAWNGVAIDLEVGDYAVVPQCTALHGRSADVVGECAEGLILTGVRPGVTQALNSLTEWAAMIRVCRKQFTGRGAFRHLEETDDETD